MKTIKVVRLEKSGRGIFRPQSEDMHIYKHHIAKKTYDRHNSGGFPLPQSEGLDMDKDELDYFISQGFKVLLLSISEYQLGDMQAIFIKESIESIEDITTLFA